MATAYTITSHEIARIDNATVVVRRSARRIGSTVDAARSTGVKPTIQARQTQPPEQLSELITYTARPGRHSSAVEQLFRKSPPVCAVLQAWKPDTNGHTYQLFVSRGCPSRIDARPVLRLSRP